MLWTISEVGFDRAHWLDNVQDIEADDTTSRIKGLREFDTVLGAIIACWSIRILIEYKIFSIRAFNLVYYTVGMLSSSIR
jgi:hypothetical protein